MYTKEFVYTNYFGETVKETCRFQLTRPEVTEIATGVKGGFEAAAQRVWLKATTKLQCSLTFRT